MVASHPSVAARSNGEGPTGAKAGTVAAVQCTKMPNLASSNQAGSGRPRWRLGVGVDMSGNLEASPQAHGGGDEPRVDQRQPEPLEEAVGSRGRGAGQE